MGKRHQFLTLLLQGWAYDIHPCINSDRHWYLLPVFLSLESGDLGLEEDAWTLKTQQAN